MKIGAHVSIAHGIENAPANARELDCECFQIFSGAPQRWPQKPPTGDQTEKFLQQCRLNGYQPGRDYVIHSPYLINLASNNNRIYYGSISALKKELATASAIQAPYVITHIGSAKDCNGPEADEKCNQLVMKAIQKIHENYSGPAMLVLEIAAGSGHIIGDRLEEIGYFIQEAKKVGIALGFCFDSCHSFAAGYDLRTKETATHLFQEIDNKVGLGNLKAIHLNDSVHGLDSKKDRHAHLGQGEIGPVGLQSVINAVKSLEINLIVETEHPAVKKDIELAKSWRDQPEE